MKAIKYTFVKLVFVLCSLHSLHAMEQQTKHLFATEIQAIISAPTIKDTQNLIKEHTNLLSKQYKKIFSQNLDTAVAKKITYYTKPKSAIRELILYSIPVLFFLLFGSYTQDIFAISLFSGILSIIGLGLQNTIEGELSDRNERSTRFFTTLQKYLIKKEKEKNDEGNPI